MVKIGEEREGEEGGSEHWLVVSGGNLGEVCMAGSFPFSFPGVFWIWRFVGEAIMGSWIRFWSVESRGSEALVADGFKFGSVGGVDKNQRGK